jgi:hypothetical protein
MNNNFAYTFLGLMFIVLSCTSIRKVQFENPRNEIVFRGSDHSKVKQFISYQVDSVTGKSIRDGLHIKIDTSMGISYGNVATYWFEYSTLTGAQKSLPIWAKTGNWSYFGTDGILDSTINYKKVVDVHWQIDTIVIEGKSYIDSSFSVIYKSKRIDIYRK